MRGEYPQNWRQISREIKERDDHSCQECGAGESDASLDVHHIDEDPSNNDPDNLITLCESCHYSEHYHDGKDLNQMIIDELAEGARTKGYLVDSTGKHRNTIRHRLDVLEAGEVVKCIHEGTALYELAEDPRDDR